MTAPDDAANDVVRTVLVPTSRDVFGNPLGVIECEPEAAGQWDARCWSDHPPS